MQHLSMTAMPFYRKTLAGTTAAIVVLIIFLIKWNSNLNDEVKRRTRELNESNKYLGVANEQLKVQYSRHNKLYTRNDFADH